MTAINTNVKSLVAQNVMSVNGREQESAMQKLSTGLRINSASDDAAGMAIASRMTGQIKGLDQAVRNANDGISMLQTADAALATVSNMMQRQHELAVQYNNATYSDADRTSLEAEFDSLGTEIGRITSATKWAGQELFVASADTRKIQVSDDTEAGPDTQIEIDLMVVADVTAGKIDNAADTDDAITAVNTLRSSIGATVNRLTYAADNAASISTNMSASRSRIQDTDYAKASSELARTQIISQASTAMLAQANQSTQSVLALLK
jgi:flagellin